MSLLQPNEDYSNFDWTERELMIRKPAEGALAGLLEVGGPTDETGLDWARQSRYEAFRALKTAYLSESPFLTPEDLFDLHTVTLQDPSSPLNSLINLSNLTTFLYLVLSSSPDADGLRPRESSANLLSASNAFLSLLGTQDEESQVSDDMLDILVDLRCQAYLSALATSRRRPSALPFFSDPLESFLPSSKGPPSLTIRQATIRFRKRCDKALKKVEITGGDKEVLETVWGWSECWSRVREVARGLALETGVGIGSDDEEEEEDLEGEESELEEVGVESQEEETEEEASEEQLLREPSPRSDSVVAEMMGAISPSKRRASLARTRAEQRARVVVQLHSDETDDQEVEEEQVQEEEGEQESYDDTQVVRRQSAAHALMDSDSEQEDESEETAVDTQVLRVQVAAHQLFSSDDSEEEEETPLETQALQNQLIAHQLMVDEEEQDGSEEMHEEEQSNEIKLGMSQPLRPLLDSEDKQDAQSTISNSESPLDQSKTAAAHQLMQEDDDEEEEDVARAAQQTSREGQVIRIGEGNKLVYGPRPPVKRSILDAQENAQVIQFDSQPPSSTRGSPEPELSASKRQKKQKAVSDPSRRPARGEKRTASAKGKERALTPDRGDDENVPPIPAVEQSRTAGGDRAALREMETQTADGVMDAFGLGLGTRDDGPLELEFGGGDEPVRGTRLEGTAAEAEEEAEAERVRAREAKDKKKRRLGKRNPAVRVVDAFSSDSEGEELVQQLLRPTPQPQRFDLPSDDEERPRGSGPSRARASRSPRVSPVRARVYLPTAEDLAYDLPDDHPSIAFPSKPGRVGRPKARRRWTDEETNLLIEEMQVYGSDWKGMVARHGSVNKPNGSISNTFQHQVNVSLKDKAVVIKLGYMRAAKEIPHWLKDIAVKPKAIEKYKEQMYLLKRRRGEVDDDESGEVPEVDELDELDE